ncbi:MAG: DUF3368 domain-containing protein [Candidatus Sumerlaeia bacterium]|nr:DUF3368 domain-containing protein [Candidatus Sumerlaeia bacterium]
MAVTAVSNTSPLIVLAKAGLERLLRDAYERVLVPEEVATELGSIPSFVVVQALQNRRLIEELAVELDRGEAAAVALAVEVQADAVVLDDRKGRLVAQRLGLPVTGTLGLVVQAKRSDRLASARTAIDQLRDVGLYLSPQLVREALSAAGEL